MNKINKIDFYCGSFLTYLISNKVEPTLFDITDNSKVIQFFLGKSDYNVFIKYSTKMKVSMSKANEVKKWDVLFTKKEKDYIMNSFYSNQKKNLIVMVCTNENFSASYFSVLTYNQAIKCLGEDDINKTMRITISHQKGSKHLYCHGTALSDVNAIQILRNPDTYFAFGDKEISVNEI